MRSLGIFILTTLLYMCSEPNQKVFINDIKQYKNTPLWELAKAVQKNDTVKIKTICKDQPLIIDYQDTKFGQSILKWAVLTNHYHSAKALLELGADPNLQENSGVSAFIEACNKFETADYAKLLLKYGGNPNAIANPKEGEDYTQLSTPLIAAAFTNFEIVKLLVDSGANINYIDKENQSALKRATYTKRIEILKYLLIDKGADFRLVYSTTIDGDTLYITNFLRNFLFPLGSKDYKIKMEVVEFLKERGMNYWETKILKHYYKNYSKEYLDKY